MNTSQGGQSLLIGQTSFVFLQFFIVHLICPGPGILKLKKNVDLVSSIYCSTAAVSAADKTGLVT